MQTRLFSILLIVISVVTLFSSPAYSAPTDIFAQVVAGTDGSLFKADTPDSVSIETNLIWQDMQNNWQLFLQKLPMIGLGLVIFILIFLLARPLSELLVRPISFVSTSQLIRLVTRRLISILFILFGFYLFLRFAGLSEFAVAVLSGTGVIGLIIGFAFKDIAENFISSLLLSIQKPFKIDDVIEVEGRIGVVKQVTARATTLVDFDGDHIQIPNATVY